MDAILEATKVVPQKRSEKRLSRRNLLNMLDDRSTVVQFYQRQPYTCVAISSWFNNKEYLGYGFSKVCYPDKWDAEEGADIAKRRAVYMIYHQVRADENTWLITEAGTQEK